MALLILARTKEYLNIASTETKFDAFLTNLIGDVSKKIRNICNQPIEQIGLFEKDIIVDEDNRTMVFRYTVPTYVLAVTYTLPFSSVDIPVTNYEEFYEGHILKVKFYDSINPDNTYKVSLAVGYTPADIPDEIIATAIEMVAMKFKESVVGENILGKQTVGSSQSGLSNTTSYKDMEAKWKKDLSKFRVLTV